MSSWLMQSNGLAALAADSGTKRDNLMFEVVEHLGGGRRGLRIVGLIGDCLGSGDDASFDGEVVNERRP